MKKLQKPVVLLIVALLLSILSSQVMAATMNSSETKLEVTDESVCTININNNVIFEKKLSKVDTTKKELTIDMSIKNTSSNPMAGKSEIFFVIDNSSSMADEISTGVTRLSTVQNSAKLLANELLKSENINIGVIYFSTGTEEGTITDATLVTAPTHTESDVVTAISSISVNSSGRTNIDAGLTLANQSFSEDTDNRYIVLLSDGIPNAAVGGPILTFSGQTAIKTRTKLETLDNLGVHILTVMAGLRDEVEPQSNKTYQALAEEIFGTKDAPTAGKYYNVSDTQIENTITKDVLKDITEVPDTTLTNISIYDYFPQEIVDNFDFLYTKKATMGTTSGSIVSEEVKNAEGKTEKQHSITWKIDRLAPQESASLSYTLTAKKEINKDILDIVLNTNKKVNIKAYDPSISEEDLTPSTDEDGKKVNVDVNSEVSPKVKLTAVPVVPTNKVDNTIANNTIPQTGDFSATPYLFIAIVLALFAFAAYKIHSSKEVK